MTDIEQDQPPEDQPRPEPGEPDRPPDPDGGTPPDDDPDDELEPEGVIGDLLDEGPDAAG